MAETSTTRPRSAGDAPPPDTLAAERPSTWLQFNWRREALLLLMSGAQTCLIVPWVLAPSAPLAAQNPLALSLVLFFDFTAAAWIGRVMAWLRLPGALRWIGALVGLLIAIGLGLSAVLNPGLSFFEAWAITGTRLVTVESSWVAEAALIGLTILAWWIGQNNGRRLFGIDSIRSTLQWGVAIWALYMVFVAIPTRDAATPYFAGYFLFTLIALALARSEETLRDRLVIRNPFGAGWFAAIGVTALAVVGIGLLAWIGLGQAMIAMWWGALGVIERLALIAADVISALFGQNPGAPSSRPQVTPTAAAPLPPVRFDDAAPEVVYLFELDTSRVGQLVPLLAIVIGVVVIALFAARASRRYKRIERGVRLIAGEEDTPASILAGGEPAGNRLRQWARRVWGGPSRWLAALTIRRIYARTLALAAECGAARPASATPYEHLPTLAQALAGVEPELQLVTQAYVRAHYGELPDTPERLAEVRAAFQRIRAEATGVIARKRVGLREKT